MNRAALPWRYRAMARGLLLSMTASLAMVACSGNSNRGLTGTIGVGTGVSLTTAGSVTQLQQATTLQVGASVVSDVNGAGVTWSLVGVGTLTEVTPTSITYNAPASVIGAQSAQITATSVVNAASTASVTLIVLGTPVITQAPLFPANVNVSYGGGISVAGGDAPFTWAMTSGTLPAGITFNGGSTAETSITGTPTAAGTYTFVLQATDTLGNVTSATFTLIVSPQAACLLQGRYAFLVSGFRGGGGATHAGSLTIDASGNITGEQDYKDGNRTTADEPITTGTCTNRATNTGVLTLNAASGQLVYNFAVTAPDGSGVVHSARLQLISSGADSASGELALLDTTALTGTAPNGNYAFGLLGVTTNEPNTVHFGSVGRFSSDASGNVSAGLIDSNASLAPLADASLSGSLSAADGNGRGTATLTAGSQSTTLAYYIVNASKMYLIDIDTQAAVTNNPRATGYLTLQSGDVTDGTFDNAAMNSPSILSLWGASGDVEPVTVSTLGRLSNANSTAGTINAVLDTSIQDLDTAGTPYIAQSYAVSASGRGSLTLLNSFDGSSRSFVFYLDGTGDGYLLEPASSAGSTGLLEAQYTPSGGSYPNSFDGYFIGGTQFAQAPGPIDLIPLVSIGFGSLSSTYTNGEFSIDPTSGRGLGSLAETGVGSTDAVLYEVSPNKFDLLRYGTRAVDGTIEWFALQ